MGEPSQLFDIEEVEQVDQWDRPRRGGNIHAAAKELSAGGYQRVGERKGRRRLALPIRRRHRRLDSRSVTHVYNSRSLTCSVTDPSRASASGTLNHPATHKSATALRDGDAFGYACHNKEGNEYKDGCKYKPEWRPVGTSPVRFARGIVAIRFFHAAQFDRLLRRLLLG